MLFSRTQLIQLQEAEREARANNMKLKVLYHTINILSYLIHLTQLQMTEKKSKARRTVSKVCHTVTSITHGAYTVSTQK